MSLISKARNYESFMEVKLKTKKPGTKKQYRIAINNMPREERMRKYVRGYAEAFPKSKNS